LYGNSILVSSENAVALKVFNLSGQLLAINAFAKNHVFELSGGIYIILIESLNSKIVRKVILL
jgi:hypothetical protein